MTQADDFGAGITADGLVVVRSSDAARRLGVQDPCASWFVTEEGRRLHATALEVDPLYETFNLVRFGYTTGLLAARATEFEQILLLGAGFDCRALWLDALGAGSCRVFEVDRADKLEQKRRVLEVHGVEVPHHDRLIAADLRTTEDARVALVTAGYDPTRPAFVIAEGLLFFLPTDTTRALLDPSCLGLAPGSRLVFDCWAEKRVRTLNERLLERMDRSLFQPFPWTVSPAPIERALHDLGYRDVTVQSLDTLSEWYEGQPVADEFPDSWVVVEAVR